MKKVLLCRKNRSVCYNSAKDSEGSVSIQRDSEPMLFFPTLSLAHNQVRPHVPQQFILWMFSGDRFCHLLLISKGPCVVLLH